MVPEGMSATTITDATCTFPALSPGSIPGSSTIVPRLTSTNTTEFPPENRVQGLVKGLFGKIESVFVPADVSAPAFVAKFHALTRPGKWGCIEWAGARKRGYGELQCNGRRLLAHRVSWVLRSNSAIPDERVVDHLCCNKGCVNADHLEVVTGEVNSRRITQGVPGWIAVGKPEPWGFRRVAADRAAMYTRTGRLREAA